MIKRCLLALIWCYQKLISPILPARCRYYPTCSHYGKQAILWHGVKNGTRLTIRRVLSCHPWGGSGVDFVPVPMYLYRYYFVTIVASHHKGVGVLLDCLSYRARLNHLMRQR